MERSQYIFFCHLCTSDRWNFKPQIWPIFHFKHVNEVWISGLLGVNAWWCRSELLEYLISPIIYVFASVQLFFWSEFWSRSWRIRCASASLISKVKKTISLTPYLSALDYLQLSSLKYSVWRTWFLVYFKLEQKVGEMTSIYIRLGK